LQHAFAEVATMDVAIISPVSPFDPRDGHRLAVLSDVHAVLDSGLTLGVVAFTYEGDPSPQSTPCPATLIRARPGGAASRLVRGVLKGMAPSLERLYTAEALTQVREALKTCMPDVVIIDDASVAGYVSVVRELLPRANVILRSHNVMHDVRREQLANTSGFLRAPVGFDCRKYLEFEREAVMNCDEHWSITEADAARMVELYGRPCGHLSVSLPLDRYTKLDVAAGKSNRFVHVGTIDFRRRSDLSAFLQVNWPQILEADPRAELTLAGKVYGASIPATNVSYSGAVREDTDVYRSGRFALNFQNSTGGLKLKTLTSMAAGRVLFSTKYGVEGLPIVSGRHYWEMSTALSKDKLTVILRDESAGKSIAEAGRQYVVDKHSRSVIARQLQSLLNRGAMRSTLTAFSA
jgi:hypothetical protein